MIGIAERLGDSGDQWRTLMQLVMGALRVACPGIVQSFDPVEQTVKVQLALRENVNKVVAYNGNTPVIVRTPTDVPLLIHVPLVLPRAGNYAVTLPVQKDDECLVIFGDMCIDAWWKSGGVQNQVEMRRHDLSDGFALLAPWSQPRVLPNYSTDSLQLRTTDGEVMVEVRGNEVRVKAPIIYTEGDVLNSNGASGTFTTQTGQVVTVQGGVITQIE